MLFPTRPMEEAPDLPGMRIGSTIPPVPERTTANAARALLAVIFLDPERASVRDLEAAKRALLRLEYPQWLANAEGRALVEGITIADVAAVEADHQSELREQAEQWLVDHEPYATPNDPEARAISQRTMADQRQWIESRRHAEGRHRLRAQHLSGGAPVAASGGAPGSRARGAGRPRAARASASRAGPSSDDGPGEPEPPGGRPEEQEHQPPCGHLEPLAFEERGT